MDFVESYAFLNEVKKNVNRFSNDDWISFLKRSKLTYAFPYVHITGINHKEETSIYLSKMLECAGYKVALFNPSEDDLLKTISINSKAISEEFVANFITENRKLITDSNLSYFEIVTFMAISYFNNEGVDIGIIQAGLGGEMDATNIPDSIPLLSIITDVTLDKTNILGTSLSEISFELAGIIKNKSQVLVGELEENSMDIMRATSLKKQNTLHLVDKFHFEEYQEPFFHFDYRPYQKLEIVSGARYLLSGAALALEAIKILRLSFPISEQQIRHGLSITKVPYRLEKHHQIYIDQAHNVEGVKQSMDSLNALASDKKIHVLFATMRDKNISSMLPLISRYTDDVVLTHVDHPYCRDEMDYFLYLGDYSFQEDWKMALSNMLKNYKDDCILLIGSRIFASEAKKYVEEVLHL